MSKQRVKSLFSGPVQRFLEQGLEGTETCGSAA